MGIRCWSRRRHCRSPCSHLSPAPPGQRHRPIFRVAQLKFPTASTGPTPAPPPDPQHRRGPRPMPDHQARSCGPPQTAPWIPQAPPRSRRYDIRADPPAGGEDLLNAGPRVGPEREKAQGTGGQSEIVTHEGGGSPPVRQRRVHRRIPRRVGDGGPLGKRVPSSVDTAITTLIRFSVGVGPNS